MALRSFLPLRSAGALLGLGAALLAQGQPDCSISLGADRTICQGQTTQLNGPPNFSNYLWSTGATTPDITVGVANDYWCQVSYPSGNLVTNGNFSAGNTGFSSQFTYSPDLWNEPNYFIGQNASWFHSQFTGVGNGNFLMANAGWQHGWWDVWCQNITVCPGQTYTISFRACALSAPNPPTLEWWVDGASAGGFTTPVGPGVWQTYSTTWTSGPNQTSANFCIKVTSAWGVGNDIGIDDISVSGTIVLRDIVRVNVTPLPVFDLGPNTTLCEGQQMLLDATVPNGTYVWDDGTTAATHPVTGPASHTYSVTVTANSCSRSDAITVNYTPLPVVDIGNDTTLCVGETLLLDAFVPGPGVTYNWQDGSTNASFLVTQPGDYQVTVRKNGCAATRSVHVDYTPLPVVDLGNDTTLCAGATLLLDATLPGGSYTWSDGSTGATLAVDQPGSYNVTVKVNGCSASDAITVAFDQPFAVDLGNDTTLCEGATLLLDATVPGATYGWNDGSTLATLQADLPGDYSVTVTRGACSATDILHVAVDPRPTVDLGGDRTICAGDPLTLDATTAGAIYRWQDGSTAATYDVGSAGPYEVDVMRGACTVHDSIHVTVEPIPVVDLGGDRIVCPGEPVQFTATTPGATYLWNDDSTGPAITTDVPGSYSVQVTVNGCTGVGSAALANFGLQTVDLGNDTVVCAGNTVPLSLAIPGATYLWSTGATTDHIDAAVTADYWVDATLNGCTVRDSVQVTVTPLPVIDLGNDRLVCPGATVLLDATTANATYHWSDGSTGPSVQAGTGSWDVTVTVSGCSSTDHVEVGERVPPTIDLGNDTTLCPGATLELDASGPGLSAVWDHGPTNAVITVAASGTYGVTVTDAFGCTGHDAITVDHFALPAVFIGNDTTLCSNALITLDATTPGADDYVWNNGSTGTMLIAGGFGTYWVDVTFGTCVVSDSIEIATVGAPTVHLGNDTTLCPGATLLLHATASADATLAWDDGSTGSDLLVSGTGTYTVTATNAAGCTATDAIAVAYLDAQGVDLGNDTTLCPGATLLLHASLPGGTNHWNDGSTGATLPVNAAGTYTVDVTASGCSFSASIDVAYVDLPALSLGADRELCMGATLELAANDIPGAAYLWDDGSTGPHRSVDEGGTYWARATLSGCTTSDTVLVTAIPLPVVDLGNDTALCANTTLPLDVGMPGGTYHWNDGSTLPTRMAGPGTWSVEVTRQGCTSSDALTITERPTPVLHLPSDTTLCEGATWTIDVTQAGAGYLWQDGSTAGTYLVQAAGAYSVTASIAACTASAAVDVNYFSPSSLELGADTSLCPGASLRLEADIPNAAITWSDGSSGTSLLVQQPGAYQVQVNVGGCIAEDLIHVAYVPLVPPDLGGDRTLCEGDSLVLRIAPGSASVLWNDGSSADSLLVLAGGTYGVSLLLDGCSASDAVAIAYTPLVDHIDLGPDAAICPGRSLTLDATTAGATYRWSTGSHAASLVVTMPGLYHVQLSGPCINAADTILIAEGDCAPEVFTPNAFTPDGDGINDGFVPSFTGEPIAYLFLVFDRWGAAIFSSEAPGVPWDGTVDGEPAPPGVYVWSLHYRAVGDDGVTQRRLIGSVTLLR
ncbi:MAG: gliding motility-associated C-terminal domain-containing protein [Bacteroidetes bacterium]|nr:gliding motility-associated C-terminal domain-containing protein [Bacteroidota bacterium]